jgi:hypothetical protein
MNSADVERRLRLWADARAIPDVHVQRWLALDEPGRTRLLELAEGLKMRAGQWIAAFSLLEEIAIRESQAIGDVLDSPSLRRIFNSAGSGPGRARLLLDELHTLRYPRLKRAAARLAEEVSAMNPPPAIKVVLPRDLASDELRVQIIAHGSSEMARVLTWLTAKTNELVRLAAMLGGADGSEVE